MPPLVPLSDVENEIPSPPRRRRARTFLPFLGEEERDRVLDDLAQRAFPHLDFYLFAILSAALLSLARIFSSPVLLVAAAASAPMLSPLVGLALGLATASPRFALRNLAALAVGWRRMFLAALTTDWLIAPFVGTQADWPVAEIFGYLLILPASAWLTVQFLRSSAKAWIPNAVVSFLLLYPVCAAAWNFLDGKWDAILVALQTAGLYFSLALVTSAVLYLALGYRPAERGLQYLGGVAAAALLAVTFLALGLSTGATGAIPAPSPTPALTPFATRTPTETAAPISMPTIPATETETLVPTETLTPTLAPIPAVVRGTGGLGVWLRDEPGGEMVDSLWEGEVIEVLGPPQEVDGVLWVPVRVPDGKTGWMSIKYCATVTPTNTPGL